MPTTESTSPDDRDRDRDTDRGERGDRGSKQKSSAATASKRGQKETCAWFVKGNCKFGHKCALAHILPGQSMAMDRKNKKAAQVAAAAASGNERSERSERGGKEGKGGRGGGLKREGPVAGAGSTGNRNPLLAGGSTAPTRMASSTPTGRPPMSLKATLSPSAPAPPLASFGVLDDLEGDGIQLASAPAQNKQSSQDSTTTAIPEPVSDSESKPKSPEPLPASAPRSATSPTKPQDFGPIGSPPNSRTSVNGLASTLSPGTSPQRLNGINVAPGTTADSGTGFLSSSPFSAPGAQSVFLSGSYTGGGGGGITASLGSGLMMGGRKAWGGENAGGMSGLAPSSVQQSGFEYEEYGARRSGLGLGRPSRKVVDTAVEDEDLEDFLPSSLNELLTPEERSRRMSRSNSGQPPATALPGFGAGELGGGTGQSSGLGVSGGHRYSRSVPAPSLLGDIKSIWSESSGSLLPSSPPIHRGTPSQSFMPRFDGGSNLGHGEDMLSMSIGSAGSGMMGLSPSNASAAFLPGLHSNYLSSKAKQAQAQALGLGGLGKVPRATSGPMYGATGSGLANSYLLGGGGSGLSSSPGSQVHTHTDARTNTQHTYRATPSPFDLTQHQHQHLHPQPHTARPIPSNGNYPNTNNNGNNTEDGPHLLSPSARALQSHAPGQSLPQGLAAGYSRIHAQPPPPTLHSPSGASVFGNTPPTEGGVPSSGPYGGWRAPAQAAASPPTSSAGLDAMFSRLSYSAAAAAKSGAATTTGTAPTSSGMVPPGLTRNVSAGRYVNPLSPLSGPVVTRDDDDDLFSMDG
ncbi:hypothetical protein DXG01_007482 [Tephrocybe rancida]|nr:hypothetical protein DXG01_007482 [Tephrocybe rancida]